MMMIKKGQKLYGDLTLSTLSGLDTNMLDAPMLNTLEIRGVDSIEAYDLSCFKVPSTARQYKVSRSTHQQIFFWATIGDNVDLDNYIFFSRGAQDHLWTPTKELTSPIWNPVLHHHYFAVFYLYARHRISQELYTLAAVLVQDEDQPSSRGCPHSFYVTFRRSSGYLTPASNVWLTQCGLCGKDFSSSSQHQLEPPITY
eukprot:scaffold912_cov187-Ochromonas_danica.AAC.3